MSGNLMDTVLRMVNTDAEPEDYKGEDGLLYCGKCHKPKEAERMGDTPLFILFQYWRRKDVCLSVFAEVLYKKADDQCPGVTGIHIFRFTFSAPYIHHFLSECFCGVMSGAVMVENPYIQPKNSFIPCA